LVGAVATEQQAARAATAGVARPAACTEVEAWVRAEAGTEEVMAEVVKEEEEAVARVESLAALEAQLGLQAEEAALSMV
jgi:hypothetical protein